MLQVKLQSHEAELVERLASLEQEADNLKFCGQQHQVWCDLCRVVSVSIAAIASASDLALHSNLAVKAYQSSEQCCSGCWDARICSVMTGTPNKQFVCTGKPYDKLHAAPCQTGVRKNRFSEAFLLVITFMLETNLLCRKLTSKRRVWRQWLRRNSEPKYLC